VVVLVAFWCGLDGGESGKSGGGETKGEQGKGFEKTRQGKEEEAEMNEGKGR
jgi:hypothetical protein